MMNIPYLEPLNSSDLRAIGIPAPWTFGLRDRVRFGELDVLGHVNNASYLQWFENLRIHYFEAYGLADYSGTPPKFVLRDIGLSFLAEVKLGDDYVVSARTRAVRRTSFTMEYAVWVRGAVTTTGHAVMVTLNDDNSRRPLPTHVRARFIKDDGAVDEA